MEAAKRRPDKLITLRQQGRVIKRAANMHCDRCGERLIEIDRYGERLTGCIASNRWSGNQSPFVVELTVEDFQALRKHEVNGRQVRDEPRSPESRQVELPAPSSGPGSITNSVNSGHTAAAK